MVCPIKPKEGKLISLVAEYQRNLLDKISHKYRMINLALPHDLIFKDAFCIAAVATGFHF